MTTTYHKKCPLFGFNLGFGPFSKKEYTDEEMQKYCGYGTHYDSEKAKCVLSDDFCASLVLPSEQTYGERQATCAASACGLSFSNDKCNDGLRCRASDEETCLKNPGCSWEEFDCHPRKRGALSSSKIRTECGEMKKHIGILCDEGTRFNVFAGVCEKPYF